MKRMQLPPIWTPFVMLLFSMTVGITILGCPRPGPVPPQPDADAAPAPFGLYDCSSWSVHAKTLGCEAGETSAHGGACTDVCTNVQTGPVPFNLQCRTLAASCEAADACERATFTRVNVDASGGEESRRTPTCADWCARAKALGCEAAKPTSKGSSCVDVCTNVQTGPKKWDLKCRTAAASCTMADACP